MESLFWCCLLLLFPGEWLSGPLKGIERRVYIWTYKDRAADTDFIRWECCRIEQDTTKSVSACSRFELVSFRFYFFCFSSFFFFSFGYLPASRREYLRSLDTNIWMWIGTACLRHLSQIQWQAHWIRWHVEENGRSNPKKKKKENYFLKSSTHSKRNDNIWIKIIK